jgi:nucleoside-diphosphate-sugar epimerase
MGLDHFIPDFIARAKLGEYRIQNGEATRSFLHVSDAAMGTVLALKQASRQTQLFHLGSMEEMSIRTAANRILTVMGLTGKTMSESQGPMGSVMRRVPDNSKAKKLLGWSPKVSFEEGILDFLNSL